MGVADAIIVGGLIPVGGSQLGELTPLCVWPPRCLLQRYCVVLCHSLPVGGAQWGGDAVVIHCLRDAVVTHCLWEVLSGEGMH